MCSRIIVADNEPSGLASDSFKFSNIQHKPLPFYITEYACAYDIFYAVFIQQIDRMVTPFYFVNVYCQSEIERPFSPDAKCRKL